MSDRVCIRGCTVKGVHYAACPDFGAEEPTCKGCVPRTAQDGALICERCFRSLRKHLEDAADVVGHLRSVADPMKAQVFDRERVQSSMPELPAPVAADLIDASDDIVRTLRLWVLHVDGEPIPARVAGLAAGADATAAHDVARELADVILADLDRLANDSHQVEALCEGIIGRHDLHLPVPVWTVADALARWSLEDRPRWAGQPCPECDLMRVRVSPARRHGAPDRYVCVECGWLANSDDDGGLWRGVFAEPVPEVRAHDPRWMTLADAARLVGFTQGTVRNWAKREQVRTEAGRYWQEDVEAVAAEKKGNVA